jgi:hypothetical protein
MANRTTDIDLIYGHTRSVQPRIFGRKFRIPFVVESETVACESVGALLDDFVDPSRRYQQRARGFTANNLPRKFELATRQL